MAKWNASRPLLVFDNEKQDGTSKMMAMLITNAVHEYKRKWINGHQPSNADSGVEA
jgi:hypothetical protein